MLFTGSKIKMIQSFKTRAFSTTNFAEIEQKWQSKWASQKSEVSDEPSERKLYILG
jgi:hypothetical protein